MSNIGRKRKQKAETKKYPSISTIPQKRTVDGSQYAWEKIYGLSDMLSWLGGRVKVEEVEIENSNGITTSVGSNMWSSWGDTLSYISEAFVFDDGAVLVCCTISTWNGTFASHDSISTAYYALEKK